MLETVYKEIPEIYNFCRLSYNNSSLLVFGEACISSEMGPQQGDPLGPLFFSLAIHPILESLSSIFTLGYLDDLTLGGPEDGVVDDIAMVIRLAGEMGLVLNVEKCEVICHNNKTLTSALINQFTRFSPSQATLLGAPLLQGPAMDKTLNRKCEDLKRAVDRLSLISAHDALLILKSSISAPKLMYTLRTSPCANHPTLESFDDLLRKGLAASTNTVISDTAWIQASLPVKDGGLGIRSVSKLAPSAFLASAAITCDLQVLMWNGAASQDGQAEADMEYIWTSRHGPATPDNELRGRQSAWDKASIMKDKNFLRAVFTGQYDQARLRATAAPHSSHWLSALPISACGLRLDGEAIRVAVGLRLGVVICEPHLCPCGHQVDAKG